MGIINPKFLTDLREEIRPDVGMFCIALLAAQLVHHSTQSAEGRASVGYGNGNFAFHLCCSHALLLLFFLSCVVLYFGEAERKKVRSSCVWLAVVLPS